MASEKKQGKQEREFHLKIRELLKKKRPEFRRQCSHKIKSVKANWRYPEGIHSKIRERRAGHIHVVETGYRSPRSVRGLHNSGLSMVMISNSKELEKINREEEGIIISKNVGMKKKLQIIEEARKKNIMILNLDADAYIKKVEEKKKEKELQKKEKKEEKAKPKEAKKKEEKKEEVKEETEEGKKEREKNLVSEHASS